MGRCLGRKLHERGWPIETICCTTHASAEAACSFIGAGTPVGLDEDHPLISDATRLVVLGTPDREVSPTETLVAESVTRDFVVLHLSGALPSSILKQCKKRGAAIGSMHPLQSFAEPEAALKIVAGSFFACEGDDAALEHAFTLAKAVGGRPIRIDTASKEIYHAAAAAASNFMIAPLLLALDLMETAGLDRKTALNALEPLILGTAKNAVQFGVPDALTGPIERNDRLVIEGHLKAIARDCPDLKADYTALAHMTVQAAARKGVLSEDQADALHALLETFGNKGK